MKKIYSDTETTGTDHRRNGMIQFSAIKVIDGVRKDSINLIIQPFEQDVIEDEALKHNGISRDELFSLTRLTPHDAHKEIERWLAEDCDKFNKDDKYHWFGYKAAFDSDFTREFFHKCGDKYFGSWFFTPPLCVMTLAGYILQRQRSRLENFKLRTVFNYLYPERAALYSEEEWHDALFDIERTIDVEDALRGIVRVNSR